MEKLTECVEPERRRVLVAEDDEEMRKLLAWAMAGEGYAVTECRDGTELMRKLGLFSAKTDAPPFDVVVSDIRMPGITGLEALEAVRELDDLPPVLFISAFADDAAREQAARLGAAGVLAKPFDTGELIRRVQRLTPGPLRHPGAPRLVPPRHTAPFPVAVTFRHGPAMDAVTCFVEEMAVKLGMFGDRILRCRVVLEGWGTASAGPRRSHVRIRVLTDTGMVVANDGHGHRDKDSVYLAVRMAFAKVSRRLKRHFRKGARSRTPPAG
jgi:CheY-like chemotaxis protein